MSSCVLPMIGYQTRQDTCAARPKFCHLELDVESHCPCCIQDSDPPSDENSSVNSGEGKQHFVSMARCVGAGVSSSATRPSEMTEYAVTRIITQSTRLLMVKTFKIHRGFEYSSSYNGVYLYCVWEVYQWLCLPTPNRSNLSRPCSIRSHNADQECT